MSHLSTIIGRIERRHYTDEEIKQDSLLEQAVINLMEYIFNWPGSFTMEEKEKAIELYDFLRPKLKGNLMPSHKERLKGTDKIRNNLQRDFKFTTECVKELVKNSGGFCGCDECSKLGGEL